MVSYRASELLEVISRRRDIRPAGSSGAGRGRHDRGIGAGRLAETDVGNSTVGMLATAGRGRPMRQQQASASSEVRSGGE